MHSAIISEPLEGKKVLFIKTVVKKKKGGLMRQTPDRDRKKPSSVSFNMRTPNPEKKKDGREREVPNLRENHPVIPRTGRSVERIDLTVIH